MAKLSQRVTPSIEATSVQKKTTNTNQTGVNSMTQPTMAREAHFQRNIRTLTLTLVDDNPNLKLSETSVFSDTVRTEHSDEQTIQSLLMGGKVQEALEKHNKLRGETIDKAVRNNTGRDVYLEPIEIWDLRWNTVLVG